MRFRAFRVQILGLGKLGCQGFVLRASTSLAPSSARAMDIYLDNIMAPLFQRLWNNGRSWLTVRLECRLASDLPLKSAKSSMKCPNLKSNLGPSAEAS